MRGSCLMVAAVMLLWYCHTVRVFANNWRRPTTRRGWGPLSQLRSLVIAGPFLICGDTRPNSIKSQVCRESRAFVCVLSFAFVDDGRVSVSFRESGPSLDRRVSCARWCTATRVSDRDGFTLPYRILTKFGGILVVPPSGGVGCIVTSADDLVHRRGSSSSRSAPTRKYKIGESEG
jgi:hypothetical protein